MQLSANDGLGHSGNGNFFGVSGNTPTISDISDQAVDEDNSTGTISFTVADVEIAAKDLVMSATSSDTNLVPNANIVLSGEGSDRTIQMIPATNQFGATTITVSVTDGISTNSESFVLTINPDQ